MTFCYSDSSRMDHTKEEFVGILQENRKNMTVKQEGQKLQQYFCAMIGKYRRFSFIFVIRSQRR